MILPGLPGGCLSFKTCMKRSKESNRTCPNPNCCLKGRLGKGNIIRHRKVKIFSRPTSLYCATSCNRHGKQKSALVEPQCFPPLRLST